MISKLVPTELIGVKLKHRIAEKALQSYVIFGNMELLLEMPKCFFFQYRTVERGMKINILNFDSRSDEAKKKLFFNARQYFFETDEVLL